MSVLWEYDKKRMVGLCMAENLLILGAGQYGCVAKETAQAMGCFRRIDFLDDNNPAAIGKLGELDRFDPGDSQVFVAMGNPQLRLRFLNEAELAGFKLAKLIHPSAVVMPSVKLDGGVIVEAQAVVNSNTVIAMGCLICAGAVVNHDCVLESGCHIDCNATVPARSHIPENTKVPCGTVYV